MVWVLKYTKEDRERIRSLAAEGKSMADVAKNFGVTRNSIAGCASREKIKFKGKGSRKVKAVARPAPKKELSLSAARDAEIQKRVRAAKRKVQAKLRRIKKQREKLTKVSMMLIDAGPMHCRWPMGFVAPGKPLCCGRKAIAGTSWCPRHSKVVFSGKSAPRLKALNDKWYGWNRYSEVK